MHIILNSTTTFPLPDEKGFHGAELSAVKEHLDKVILPRINGDALPDWTLRIKIILTKGKWIGVSKRGTTYIQDREVCFGIVIPIPDTHQAKWGVKPQAGSFLPDLDEKKFSTLAINYDDYPDFCSFVVDAAKKGIYIAFSRGLTVNGVSVRFRNPLSI